MNSKHRCCNVTSMCGRTLCEGIVFIGIVTVIVSSTLLIYSSIYFVRLTSAPKPYNSHPVLAINMIFALVCTSLSVYQIIISLLLLWQSMKVKQNIYLCSLWYVSHLSILALYMILCCAKTVVYLKQKLIWSAVFTISMGLTYQGTYIYFCVVVNSYLNTLDQDRYF
ncbi:uncharacterized protein LOC131855664 [Achroia grisella]|uniref:uncharacterized protein LOC131855664 n=1 Tax=Achroia grisella TaxID=688607 RepID=UPI0027D2C41C|nr:uncharacterized protein LOC131855664 [Achroia grisella]